MFKQLIHVWQNNHGTILAICGAAVAVTMSLAWRWDLIPDIGPAIQNSPTLLGSRAKPTLNLVVVSITAENMQDAEVTMQIFSPSEPDAQTSPPVATRTARLEDGLSEFVITDLARGVYAGFAYIDINANGQLDVAENGLPTEPFGFVKTKTADDTTRPADGVFEVVSEPLFLKIHLPPPRLPSNSSPAKSSNAR